MKNILNFNDYFITEGRDFKDEFTPLYHLTYKLPNIMEDDMLKIGNPSRGPKGVCVTRSKYFSHDGFFRNRGTRLILNRDILKKDGYIFKPLDEWAHGNIEAYGKIPKDKNHIKSYFPSIKNGKRGIDHKLDLVPKKDAGLEIEFEERCLKNIKNLGKYIYAINFLDESNRSEYLRGDRKEDIKKYLEKYPDIKIFMGKDVFKDITNEFKEELFAINLVVK